MPKIFADTNEAVKRKILDCADGSSKLTLSLVTQMVKNLSAMQTWVPDLVWEDSLDKGMATHSSIFAWRIPWKEEPDGLKSMGLQRVRHY